jgi:hypothetical protein
MERKSAFTYHVLADLQKESQILNTLQGPLLGQLENYKRQKIIRDRNNQNILALVIYSTKSRHGSGRWMTLTEDQTDGEAGICN